MEGAGGSGTSGALWARRQLVSLPKSLQDGQDSAGVTLGSNFGFRTTGILESCLSKMFLYLQNGTKTVHGMNG